MLSAFGNQFSIRPVRLEDRNIIQSLIENHEYYHHHLDWRSPLDWLGDKPYIILTSVDEAQAALACPPRPEGIGWIRLFVVSRMITPGFAWRSLLSEAIRIGKDSGVATLAGLGFMRWFCDLLETSGFAHTQNVVGLSRKVPAFIKNEPVSGFIIRSIQVDDLPEIASLDARAFDPLWQHPLDSLNDAFNQAGYGSVVTMNEEIVGYQLSTCSTNSAHLARLAIEPRLQNRHLGRALIMDLFQNCLRLGLDHVTVNTQSENQPSLALYRKVGFELSGEKYPVYTLHII